MALQYVDLRDHERNVLQRFLQGPGGFLHVCGMPGTGKTMLVKHLLGTVGTVGTVGTYIHCHGHDAATLSEELELVGFEKGKVKVVVLDELTSLGLGTEQLLIDIVQTASRQPRWVIAISNSLNQAWRSVVPDIDSLRVEPDLPFPPHTSDQLCRLIHALYPDLFSQAAAKYIASQVAAQELGDARVLVSLCQMAAQSQDQGQVSFQAARQVITSALRTPTNEVIQSLPLEYKTVLANCVHLAGRRGSGFRQSDLFLTLEAFRKRHKLPRPTSTLTCTLEMLQCSALVTTNRAKDPKVDTKVTPHDLDNGLSSAERLLFREFIHL
jgi:Cdc6-like AAA superfamily ATPase